MGGSRNEANAIWLWNWRKVGLHNAKRTGGCLIQVLVQPGPSCMQDAEEDMALCEGVPVIKIRCEDNRMDPMGFRSVEAHDELQQFDMSLIAKFPALHEMLGQMPDPRRIMPVPECPVREISVTIEPGWI